MLYGLNESNNPRLYERYYVVGPSGTKQIVQVNRPISLICVSVTFGAIDLFFGGDPAGRLVPDYHFGQTNKPEWVPYTGAPGDVCIYASGYGTNLACVMFGGP